MSDVVLHLESCGECYELFRDEFEDKRGDVPVLISLTSQSWLKDEHLEYEQIVSYADSLLSDEDREILNGHIMLCGRCREDIQSFIEHRRQIEPDLKRRYIPSETKPVRSRYFAGLRESFKLPFKPAFPIYALLLVGSLVFIVILLRRGRSIEPNLNSATPIVKQTPNSIHNQPIRPPSTPDGNTIAVRPSIQSIQPDKTSVRSGASPPTSPKYSERLVVALSDGGRQISLDDTGNLIGLGDLSAINRKVVKDTLSTGKLQRPVILEDIIVEKSAIRSKTVDQQTFKLLSPEQAVIVESKPVFKWEPLAGALGYKVSLASSSNWAGMSSPALDSSTFEWIPPTPLIRGKDYTWVVTAITEKGELTVPASSQPERKFKIMSARDLNALVKLKRQTDSHLVLGLFYARSGLVVEAEKEFQNLENENVGSSFVARLLEQIRSWR